MQHWLTLLIIVLVLLAMTLWCVWWQWEYRNDTFIRAQRDPARLRRSGSLRQYAHTDAGRRRR